MFAPDGTVDHFLPVSSRRDLAYEWHNYRFAAHWINAVKGDAVGILDPHEVGEGWFEILLPSLQLVVTDRVPPELRALAVRTVERLHLRDDERVIGLRQEYLEMYEAGELVLAGLRRLAPLLAAAVEKRDGLAGGPR